jgi:hypothetical protein
MADVAKTSTDTPCPVRLHPGERVACGRPPCTGTNTGSTQHAARCKRARRDATGGCHGPVRTPVARDMCGQLTANPCQPTSRAPTSCPPTPFPQSPFPQSPFPQSPFPQSPFPQSPFPFTLCRGGMDESRTKNFLAHDGTYHVGTYHVANVHRRSLSWLEPPRARSSWLIRGEFRILTVRAPAAADQPIVRRHGRRPKLEVVKDMLRTKTSHPHLPVAEARGFSGALR